MTFVLSLSRKRRQNFFNMALVTLIAGMSSQYALAATQNFYQVKSGDTLQSIANQDDTTVNNLININNLTDKNDIKVGDKIYLSDVTALTYRGKTTTYIVQNGDSLSSIARRFNTKTTILAELNEFDSATEKLYVGNKIIVPAVVIPTMIVATAAPTVKTSNNDTLKTSVTTKVTAKAPTFDYQVKSGETLFGIANKYKIDKNELMALNGLDASSKVAVGQKLLIPNTADKMNALAVDKAKATTSTVATAQPAKKITTSTAKTSKVATAATVDFDSYKVKSGDSLSSLAARYNTTVVGLAKINAIPVNSPLKQGQIIYVPVQQNN